MKLSLRQKKGFNRNIIMSNESREFDLVVFGASGFTGQFVVEEVARTSAKEPINWAIAGRSSQKLAEVLSIASNEVGIDLNNIAKIEANTSDDKSLLDMCRRTKVVLNCVGPYQFLGEQVVKACVEAATNHLDISAEPLFMETMALKYNKAAQEKGIYIVSACGWGYIPWDLGVQYLKTHFDGELNSVETFMTIRTGPNGYKTNYGTWQSAIHGFAHFSQMISIRRRLYTEIFTKTKPQSKYKLKKRIIPFKNKYTNRWSVLFPESDKSVVERTQQYKYEKNNERPTQIESYFTVPSLLSLLGILILGAIFGVFAFFRCGRYLLERYPEFFSFGLFSKVGPTREQINDDKFELTIVGNGWNERLAEPTEEPNLPFNKTVAVRVNGLDPGYLATSTALVQSGFTVLKEFDKMPESGGVLTPGAAFDGTNIYQRLAEHDMTFELLNIG